MCDLVKKFRDLEYDSDIAEDLLFRMPRIQKKKVLYRFVCGTQLSVEITEYQLTFFFPFFAFFTSALSRFLASLAAFMSFGAVVRRCFIWVGMSVGKGVGFESQDAAKTGMGSSIVCR